MKALVAVTLLVMLAGCDAIGITCACTHPPTLPAGAITREEAIYRVVEAATPAAFDTVKVVSADLDGDPFDGNGPLVWEVRVDGPFSVEVCAAPGNVQRPAPANQPCQNREAALIGVIDATTGAFIGWLP